jgi:hypothetical protein
MQVRELFNLGLQSRLPYFGCIFLSLFSIFVFCETNNIDTIFLSGFSQLSARALGEDTQAPWHQAAERRVEGLFLSFACRDLSGLANLHCESIFARSALARQRNLKFKLRSLRFKPPREKIRKIATPHLLRRRRAGGARLLAKTGGESPLRGGALKAPRFWDLRPLLLKRATRMLCDAKGYEVPALLLSRFKNN